MVYSNFLILHVILCIIYVIYVIVKSRYEHDIQVIVQDRGKADVACDDLDIMQVNWDITNFYPMQIDFQLVNLNGNNRFLLTPN